MGEESLRVHVAAGVDVVAVTVGGRARARQLVGDIGGEARDRVVAEQHDELIGRGRRIELALKPLELRVVDVPVGGGADHAGLGDAVERDEPEPGLGAPRVVAGGAARARLLGGVDQVEAVAVGLRARAEDVLVLGLGDEPPLGVGRDQADLGRIRSQQGLDSGQVEPGDVGERPLEGLLEPARIDDDRCHRLHAAGRHRLVGGIGRGVALHERVVVAEGDVEGNLEPGRLERLLRAVDEGRVGRPVGEVADGRVRVVVLGIRPLEVVTEVLDAGVVRRGVAVGDQPERVEPGADRIAGGRRVDAAARVERAALHQGPDPLGLVQLLAVCEVAGADGELHRREAAVARGHGACRRERVQLPDHRVVDLRVERLVWADRGRERPRVDELDARRRFLVGELEVGELPEVQHRLTPVGAPALRRPDALLADDVGGLAGAERELLEVGVGVGDDPLLERRLRERVRVHRGRGSPDRGHRRSGRHSHSDNAPSSFRGVAHPRRGEATAAPARLRRFAASGPSRRVDRPRLLVVAVAGPCRARPRCARAG